jgi:calcineurin-like phosphoesterase family protein
MLSIFDLFAPATPFDRPHLLYTFLTQPLHLVARLCYHFLAHLRPHRQPRHHKSIRVVCLSDTHSLNPGKIPDGDVLIHAGDITAHGTPSELQAAIDLLSALPHKHKYIIAGNHDTYLDESSRATLSKADQHAKINWKNLTYLQHSTESIYLPTHNPACISTVARKHPYQTQPSRSLTPAPKMLGATLSRKKQTSSSPTRHPNTTSTSPPPWDANTSPPKSPA